MSYEVKIYRYGECTKERSFHERKDAVNFIKSYWDDYACGVTVSKDGEVLKFKEIERLIIRSRCDILFGQRIL